MLAKTSPRNPTPTYQDSTVILFVVAQDQVFLECEMLGTQEVLIAVAKKHHQKVYSGAPVVLSFIMVRLT